MKSLLAVLVLLSVSGLAAAGTEVDAALTAIGRGMDAMSTFSARFTQLKRFRILTSELRLEGNVYLRREPFRLAWHIEKPLRYTAVMDNDRLRQWDEETAGTREYRYNENPALKLISRTYRDLLLGDFNRLAGECELRFDRAARRLTVVPRPDTPMAKALARIEFTFEPGFRYLVRIAIEEPGGNSTVIDFSDIKLNGVLPDAAWKTGDDT